MSAAALASAEYRRAAALERIPEVGPIPEDAVAEAMAAADDEAAVLRSLAARPITTTGDVVVLVAVLGALAEREVWPAEAVTIARNLAAAVERLAADW